jgi:glyoxylase-like metal-dependent hydrolase (beta-lactamase superfamily II)
MELDLDERHGAASLAHGGRARRRFLEGAGAAAAGWSLSRVASAGLFSHGSSDARLTVTRLSGNLAVISGAGGNVVALNGPDGRLLVDSGAAEHTKGLMRTLAALPGGRRVRTVFNTHWHWCHTGGNERLHRAGAGIVAHENTRLWLGAQIRDDWRHRIYPPRPREAWPTRTFYYKTCHTSFAGEPIEYGYLGQAHTDGDIYVYFRRLNVLAVGGVLSVGRYPILDYCTGGWIGGMAAATGKLLKLTDADTRIIPGAGPVQTRADLQAEHDMLTAVHARLWALMRKGMSASDMIAAHPTAAFDAKWGSPDLFIRNAYRGMYGHIAEYLGKGVV